MERIAILWNELRCYSKKYGLDSYITKSHFIWFSNVLVRNCDPGNSGLMPTHWRWDLSSDVPIQIQCSFTSTRLPFTAGSEPILILTVNSVFLFTYYHSAHDLPFPPFGIVQPWPWLWTFTLFGVTRWWQI